MQVCLTSCHAVGLIHSPVAMLTPYLPMVIPKKAIKPVQSLQPRKIIPSWQISWPFNLLTHCVFICSDYVWFGTFQSPLVLKITNKRASSRNMNCGKISNSPLVSQSWKETAPSYLVTSPPPHGKQRVLPGSGWYVPRGQTLQGLKPSEE